MCDNNSGVWTRAAFDSGGLGQAVTGQGRAGQGGPGWSRVGQSGAGVLGLPLVAETVTMVRVAGMFPTTLSLPSRGRHRHPGLGDDRSGRTQRQEAASPRAAQREGEEVTHTATHAA